MSAARVSGKTTTLYAVISEIKTGLEKFVTIEDPVEYELAGVLQIPVNEKKGLTFSRGLRSILRHDPDKILVGEIRDAETAEIAVQAALTGHGVFTTIHANNPFDVVGRFLHMAIDLFSFASALNGIVSQRLVRRVCDHCGQPASFSDRFRRVADELRMELSTAMPRRGRGCEVCRYTGYKGRFAVAEVVVMDDVLRQMMIERAALASMKSEIAQRGARNLRQAGAAAVLQGMTTEEEFRRVVAAG
jgi:general secretion pathway protein E